MPASSARRSLLLLAGIAAIVVVTSGAMVLVTPPPAVVVHEWGTFTTVAGEDGFAAQWLPLGGEQDLPCFVEHFKKPAFKIWPGAEPPLDYAQARGALRGKVRMETPVLYFYADREAMMSVSVRFPNGLMSEWYPKALIQQPHAYASVLSAGAESRLTWASVWIRPGTSPVFPDEGRPSHYYAARRTDAAPVRVEGQDEKFLFYRGLGSFDVPIQTRIARDGRILVTNLDPGAGALPSIVLFENRGGRVGYRIHSNLSGEVTLETPALTSSVAALGVDLEGMLVATGLYAKEAKAMVDTWRDSWFEEGTRVFYIVAPRAVDAILPLTFSPAPSKVARAFVGRMEVITDRTLQDVKDAIAEADDAALAPYARFLEPIASRLLARLNAGDRAKMDTTLSAAYRSHLKRVVSYCQ